MKASLASLLCPALLAAASSSSTAQTLLATQEGADFDYLGTAVAGIGDVNLDGVPDYAAADFTGLNAYSGADHSMLWTLVVQFTYSLDAAGDLNGDRRPDVIVGHPGYSNGKGAVYVVDGATGIVLDTVAGIDDFTFMGTSVTSLGDVDGDGVSDFAAGVSNDSTSAFRAGAVRVFSGASRSLLYTLYGNDAGDNFGASVASITDLDLDGIRDLAVGAPLVDGVLQDSGAVEVFSGATGAWLWSYGGRSASGVLGDKVADAGDLDADGRGDVLVAQPGAAADQGSVIALSGAQGLSLFSVQGSAAGDELGLAGMAAVGDVNLDGTPDFITSARRYDPPGLVDAGLILLCSGIDGATLYRFEGTEAGALLGTGLDSAGDLDGNGIQDLVAGEAQYGNQRGRVSILASFPSYSQTFGTGWPGTLGVPAIQGVGQPAIGEVFGVNIDNSRGSGTPALLFVGIDEIQVPTTKGGTLWVNPFLIQSLPLPGAGLTLAGPIPDDPSLIGVSLYVQALEVDPGASHGVAFTPGLHVVIGYEYL